MVGLISFLGWGALLFSPLKREKLVPFARVICLILALFYCGNILFTFGEKPNVDFSSLAGVSHGFSNLNHLLTGWIHFLAFDLFLGIWEVEKAKQDGIKHWILIPCLLFTFMYGPVGFVLFVIVRSIKLKKLAIA